MPVWLDFFGRLHPLLVHLPIGVVAAWAALEVLARLRHEPLAAATARALAWLAAASAAGSAAAGLALARSLGETEGLVERHRLLGLGTAGACLLAAILTSREKTRAAGRAALAASLALLAPTGHLGATLVHGEGYLLEPFAADPKPRAESAVGPTEPIAPIEHRAPAGTRWENGIAQLFATRCGACHGAARQRGGLALHTLEKALLGGKHGPVIAPGEPAASEIVRKLRLAPDVKGHMPPSSKPQPTEAEIAAIEAWIAIGAPGEELPEGTLVVPEAAADEDQAEGGDEAEPGQGARAAPIGPDSEALAALAGALVHAEPLAPGEPWLSIHFATLPGADDARIGELLEPLVPWVAELSLARTAAGRQSVALAARMEALESLDLGATAVDDAALEPLVGHARLARLVLAQTGAGDASVDTLASLPALRKLYLWGSRISPAGLERLAALRPDISVDAGTAPPAQALESEGEIALSGDRPPPSAPAAPAAEPPAAAPPLPLADGAPINARCPVSGSPVDPRHTLVHEGRLIGFCCPNCPGEFAKDPAAYLGKLGL